MLSYIPEFFVPKLKSLGIVHLKKYSAILSFEPYAYRCFLTVLAIFQNRTMINYFGQITSLPNDKRQSIHKKLSKHE